MAAWRPRWWELAECAQHPLDTFFPSDEMRGNRKKRHIDKARRICARCPVSLICLDRALEADERFGVFGGCDMEQLKGRKNASRKAELHRWVKAQLNGDAEDPPDEQAA